MIVAINVFVVLLLLIVSSFFFFFCLSFICSAVVDLSSSFYLFIYLLKLETCHL